MSADEAKLRSRLIQRAKAIHGMAAFEGNGLRCNCGVYFKSQREWDGHKIEMMERARTGKIEPIVESPVVVKEPPKIVPKPYDPKAEDESMKFGIMNEFLIKNKQKSQT